MSDAGSHSSDELADEHTLEVPCVLCPTSPFPPGDAAPRCSVVVRRIRVDGFVHGGLGRWSQVYCGRILEADGLSPDDAPEPLVVVKLVDPLRFVPDEDNPDEEEPTEAARRMCVNEATAYAALVGVPVVPQWYGSYHFQVQEGRTVVGHVLERIEGNTIKELSDDERFGWDAHSQSWARSVLDALDQLHQRKVYHLDIGPANVMVPSDPDPDVPVMFVDFGHASANDPDDLDDQPAKGHRGTEAYHSSRNDYSRLASLLTKHLEVPHDTWKAWLRGIVPKTPVVRRTMEGWSILDTIDEEADDYRRVMRRLGRSESEIEAQVVRRFPSLQISKATAV